MPIRVLLCDDHALLRAGLKALLADERGIEVVGEAADGAAAVEQAVALRPDVALVDITMPELDGLAAMRQIREQDPEARIVMCSAMGQSSMVIESIQAGARDFIVKPFQPERVLEAVKKALA